MTPFNHLLPLQGRGIFSYLHNDKIPLQNSGFISCALYLLSIEAWSSGKCQLLHPHLSPWIPAFWSFLLSEECPHFPASSEMNFKGFFQKILDLAILGALYWEEFPWTPNLPCVALSWILSNWWIMCFITVVLWLTPSSFSKDLDY